MQTMADSGMIPKLDTLLPATDRTVCAEALWCLTNMAAAETKYVQSMQALGLPGKLLAMFIKGDSKMKAEASV